MHERRDEWSVDAARSLLGNPDRRQLLRELKAADGTVLVGELAEALATATEEPVDVDRVQIALTHVHLPVLSAADIVEYDSEQGVVRPTDRVERLCTVAEKFDRVHRQRA